MLVQPTNPDKQFGLPVLAEPVLLSAEEFKLIQRGIKTLWQRIADSDTRALISPLLLSFDVHPTPDGPVLIEVNTNAGGILAALGNLRQVNSQCAELEQEYLNHRLLQLLKTDLLGATTSKTEKTLIVDDHLQQQPLLEEMQGLARLMVTSGAEVDVADCSELQYRDGKLWHQNQLVHRLYWRSTDFDLSSPEHTAIQQAYHAKAIHIAPSPEAWHGIANKSNFIRWSKDPTLAVDEVSGQRFNIAETLAMHRRQSLDWYRDRRAWVFKPRAGYASRGVYLGRKISWAKLESLPAEDYLAQTYAPHPTMIRDGQKWKYDLRFFVDRGNIIGAAARVFQGQVMGMGQPGSGFAPLRIGDTCCLTQAIHAVQA